MPTNEYFDNFYNRPEQTLIEDLIIESIKIYGHDVFYCPRTVVARDNVLNEDALSEYNSSYQIEMYIKNVEGFEGEGDFLSRFNIQIRDEITFTVANRRYDEAVGAYESSIRPEEGDIIYFPLTEKIYVIKFAEHEAPVFYQMGALQCYDLRCEQWEYSSEKLNTGVEAIDKWAALYSDAIANTDDDSITYDANNNIIMDANTGRPLGMTGTIDVDDVFDDGGTYQSEALDFIDFSEEDPFSEGGQY
jgi:hypothetical protein